MLHITCIQLLFTFSKGSTALVDTVSDWVNAELFCIKDINGSGNTAMKFLNFFDL